MRDIRRTLGVLAAPLLLVFALAKVAKVAGWGAALAGLAGLTVGLLGAVALLSLGRSRGWPRGARRVRVYGSGRDPIPVHAGARTPQDVEISEAELNGTVVELEMGDVGSAIAPARRPRGAATAPRHRQLHECADDSLTPPRAAASVADGLERLFLLLGPPPGAAGPGPSPGDPVPTPRGDDRRPPPRRAAPGVPRRRRSPPSGPNSRPSTCAWPWSTSNWNSSANTPARPPARATG